MLDTAGELLEKLVRPRQQAAIRAAGDLSEKQYGSQTGRSTIYAIQEVVKAVKSTERGNHFSRPVCLLVTLGINNAFNSVRWVDALQTLKRNFRVPQYLLHIIGDYLRDRLIETEIVLLTKKRIPRLFPVQLGEVTAGTTAATRYSRVVLNTKFTFWDQRRKEADKAAEVASSLSRMMANIRAPRPCVRRLLLRTAESIMLYGAEIWADAMQYEKFRKRRSAVQRRGALRLRSLYRTVSEPAVLVIAGVILVDLRAQGQKFVHQFEGTFGRGSSREVTKEQALGAWKRR